MEKTATFAAGCFWGVEDAFRQVKGVTATEVGYTGGTKESPTYKEVCTGRTGHAEAVKVTYDPDVVSYEDLLDIFWSNHDPTQLNRQGPDFGTQYRTEIFVLDDEQKQAAVSSKQEREASGRYRRPIVTAITSASTFWRAEEYHQQYFEKQGISHCRI
jgi:peptide-methionine (S)-S-oxide reductase